MPEEHSDLREYQSALTHLRFEGNLLWQIFGSFLLCNTVFLAFLLQAVFNGSSMTCWRPGSFSAGIIGLLICIPWFATYSRNSSYYIFRMAQAREAEPQEWRLLRDRGQSFAAGESVSIGDDVHRVSWLGRVMRASRSVPCLIFVFVLTYALVIVVSGPWWSAAVAPN